MRERWGEGRGGWVEERDRKERGMGGRGMERREGWGGERDGWMRGRGGRGRASNTST